MIIAIHGDKQQNERDWVLDQFKTGKSPIMVATDVASRGIGMIISPSPSPPLVATSSRVISAVLYSHVCLGAFSIALHLPDLFVLRGSHTLWVTGIHAMTAIVLLYMCFVLVPLAFPMVQARNWHLLIPSSCRKTKFLISPRTRAVLNLLQAWHLACCRNRQSPFSQEKKHGTIYLDTSSLWEMLHHHPLV